jgi:hypothetical protein
MEGIVGKGDFLDPKTFQSATPTLGVGSTTTPPNRGDFLNTISLTAGDPDRSEAFTGFEVDAPTIGPSSGSWLPPVAHGDVGDVLGSSQNSDTGQGVYALISFQTVSSALGLGSVATPTGKGDIGDVGGPSELPGIPNDSGAGPAYLIAWGVATPTLGVGSTIAPKQHGDLGEIYGTLGSTVEGLTWEVVTPTLATGTVAPPQGKGDFTDPYTWQDTILYLTSQPYPVIYIEQIGMTGSFLPGMMYQGLVTYLESLGMAPAFSGGSLTPALLVYSNWPVEKIQMSAAFSSSGSLTLALVSYSNWPVENMQMSATFSGGSLTFALVSYSNWPVENMQMSATFSGGSLS